uniref:SH3 and SYLF domain containing 1 n=1 Tax=Salmo trutta TaxID=8032 RepID=A0A673ZV54_SALTR
MCVLTVNNPIPSNMKSEAKKAAKILRHFTEISSRTGPYKLIPANILANGQGLAIITVVKAGFMITAWGSRGIVIARLADCRKFTTTHTNIHTRLGRYAVYIVSDLVVILMHRRAVDSISKGGNLTLGVNCTVSVDIALRSTAAVFTYCKSRGLFAGVSLEGPCLIEHKDTNHKYVTHRFPPAAPGLYCVLETYTDQDTTERTAKHRSQKLLNNTAYCSPRHTVHQHDSLYTAVIMCLFLGVGAWYAGPEVVPAIHPFTGRHPGELSFNPSNRITVVTKTELQYDWWGGMLNGRTGIFPANFLSYP